VEGWCTIDGAAVDRARVSVRSMNFGQHWRTEGVVACRYELGIPDDALVQFLEGWLPQVYADLEDGEPLDRALAHRPAPRALLADRALAARALAAWDHELLLRYLDDGGGDAVLNTIDQVELVDGGVVMRGEGRRAGVVRYQDA
jgi:hypothetical protein